MIREKEILKLLEERNKMCRAIWKNEDDVKRLILSNRKIEGDMKKLDRKLTMMLKTKTMKTKTESLALKILKIVIFVLLGFLFGAFANIETNIGEPINIGEFTIPNSEQVDYFCEQRGFDYGWLSSVCGGIMCFEKVSATLDRSECFE